MNAPQVTSGHIQAKIKNVAYTLLPDGRTTICQITMANGYTVLGKSACVCIENYNQALGEKYAYENAFNNIWQLEGYLLAERLHSGASSIDLIARVAHEVNRAYCKALGDDSQVPWDEAPEWQQVSARDGVAAHLKNDMSPEESHATWLAHKLAAGWGYGPVKDEALKQHPCMVNYDQLPHNQRVKDHLFKAVVDAFKALNLKGGDPSGLR